MLFTEAVPPSNRKTRNSDDLFPVENFVSNFTDFARQNSLAAADDHLTMQKL